jgi:hypothetical protein
MFLFATVTMLALGPTQPSVQWVLGTMGVKWPRLEVGHSPPSSAEVENVCSYTFTPPYVFMVWCLVKYSIYFHGMVLS